MSTFSVSDSGSLVPRTTAAPRIAAAPPPALLTPSNTTFSPIGPNLPLTIEIAHLYTGKYPGNILGSSPMLVSSAVKNLDQTGAASEAVNYLINRVSKRSNFPAPPSDAQGTKLICYIPAVTAPSTTLTLNLVFENFPDGFFTTIEGVFSGAGQIPLFLSASPYLIGGGVVLKLVQDIGDAIFNGKPNFNPTISLNFSDIGPQTTAGYQVLFKTTDDPNANVSSFTFVPNQGLIDPATNQQYQGDAPYMVIAIDGAERDDLKTFAPLAASANILSTFFNIKDGGTVPVTDILNVVKAASDVTYGKQALALKAKIAAETAAGQSTTSDQAALSAAVANIEDPDLAKLFRSANAAAGS